MSNNDYFNVLKYVTFGLNKRIRTLNEEELAAFGLSSFEPSKGWKTRYALHKITRQKALELLSKRTDERRSFKAMLPGEFAKLNAAPVISEPVVVHKPMTLHDPKWTVKANFSDEFIKSEDFLKSYEWRTVRMQVIKKYGTTCMCCGATPDMGAVMNVDHIKSRKKYPELALVFDNLQVLCGACNHGKGNWDETDWRPLAKRPG